VTFFFGVAEVANVLLMVLDHALGFAMIRHHVMWDPNFLTSAERWRGRTDRREAVLRGLLVEAVSGEVMKLAGWASAPHVLENHIADGSE
jgi:hypothetical protein